MSVFVSHGAAKKALERAWSDIGSSELPPTAMQKSIEEVLGSPDVTFKYILVTGFLAKFVNPEVHARALQTVSELAGAYDARSLCHQVVVGFEKSKGNLFGLSNEPFVSKPARHPEHDKDNAQLRNRPLAKRLHTGLELAQAASHDDLYRGLVHILRIGAQRAANVKTAQLTARANIGRVVEFVNRFLEESDGGARLVGV